MVFNPIVILSTLGTIIMIGSLTGAGALGTLMSGAITFYATMVWFDMSERGKLWTLLATEFRIIEVSTSVGEKTDTRYAIETRIVFPMGYGIWDNYSSSSSAYDTLEAAQKTLHHYVLPSYNERVHDMMRKIAPQRVHQVEVHSSSTSKMKKISKNGRAAGYQPSTDVKTPAPVVNKRRNDEKCQGGDGAVIVSYIDELK